MNGWPTQDYPNCIDVAQLRPGDILLTYSQDRLSQKVQLTTGDRYTHASIYLGGREVAEATLQGVQRNTLEIPDKGHIAVFRHQTAFNDECVIALHGFVDEMIATGARYDEIAKGKRWVKALREKQKDSEVNWQEKLEAYFTKSEAADPPSLEKFVCSAFVATCYFKVGLLGDSINATIANPQILLPQDLGDESGYYGRLVGYIALNDYRVPVDDPFYNRSIWSSEIYGW